MSRRLLVDLGNTRIKWWLEQGDLLAADRAEHHGTDGMALAERCFAALAPPQQVVIASVAAPAVTDALADWMRQHWSIDPVRLVSPAHGLGVRNAYAEPARLGVDRWLTLIAAWHQGLAPAVIVDCGTAITIDALAGDGRHLGGVILPGPELQRQSLSARARGIPDEPWAPAAPLGRDTRSGVSGGCILGVAAAIDAIARQQVHALGGQAMLVITGGGAEQILPWLASGWLHRPGLVLEGLRLWADALPPMPGLE